MDSETNDLLQYAIDNAIIDLHIIRVQTEMKKKNELLSMHKGATWQGKDGKYYTWCPKSLTELNDERVLLKRKSEEELNKAIVEYYKALIDEPKFGEVFYRWLKQKLEYGEITKQTYDKYEQTYKTYLKGTNIDRQKLCNISEIELEDFIKRTIHERELTSKGWADIRLVINGTFKYGKKRGFTKMSISSFMGDLDLSRKAFKRRVYLDEESVFNDEEVEAIFEYVKQEKDNILNLGVILAFQTGLRVGEISTLTYDDLQGDKLYIHRTEVKYRDEKGKWSSGVGDATKGRDGHRKITITEGAIQTIEMVHELNPDGEFLFQKGCKRIRGCKFTRRLYRICDKLNIRRRSMHKIRKTYATKLIDAQVGERLIMKQLGHTAIETTKMYYYFSNKNDDYVKSEINRALGNLRI